MPHENALIDRLAALHPAVVSDCLDLLGHRHQVMAPSIRPLAIGMRLAGVAATVHVVADDGIPADRSQWHRGTIAAVDALQPGDVLVASHCDAAFWGELLATAAALRGARGVVADAYARDTLALIDMDFATFARGINCADALGRIRVEAAGVPIECGGVRVNPGDFVLGDHDGLVVLPAAAAPKRSHWRSRRWPARIACAANWRAACRWPKPSARTACSSQPEPPRLTASATRGLAPPGGV